MSFALIDYEGNTLKFDSFRYQSDLGDSDRYELNWLCCCITIHATVTHSVDGFFLTWELVELAGVLRAAVNASPTDTEAVFETMEPYINLAVSRADQRVLITARLDLRPGIGPVIEFDFECEPAAIVVTIGEIQRTIERFPERKPFGDQEEPAQPTA